jgi:hypothetical protein
MARTPLLTRLHELLADFEEAERSGRTGHLSVNATAS